ncbi:putative monovalent cation/H+ antiporter 3 subunit D [Anopheles sinensis]|uniref:Putative monovalent cation/H+ antiporter 3 subunit D n=1 Tax=Anopheles sinensis TaxID=74873 RepID=A0A084WUT5_ANOSI|nr:putative monovalent cation/H+ antiporter 3 subunit D [Anopheles sinensis]
MRTHQFHGTCMAMGIVGTEQIGVTNEEVSDHREIVVTLGITIGIVVDKTTQPMHGWQLYHHSKTLKKHQTLTRQV